MRNKIYKFRFFFIILVCLVLCFFPQNKAYATPVAPGVIAIISAAAAGGTSLAVISAGLGLVLLSIPILVLVYRSKKNNKNKKMTNTELKKLTQSIYLNSSLDNMNELDPELSEFGKEIWNLGHAIKYDPTNVKNIINKIKKDSKNYSEKMQNLSLELLKIDSERQKGAGISPHSAINNSPRIEYKGSPNDREYEKMQQSSGASTPGI